MSALGLLDTLTWRSFEVGRRRWKQKGCSGWDWTTRSSHSGSGHWPSGGWAHIAGAAHTDALQIHTYSLHHIPQNNLQPVFVMELKACIGIWVEGLYQCCCNIGRLSPGHCSHWRLVSPSLRQEPIKVPGGLHLLLESKRHTDILLTL